MTERLRKLLAFDKFRASRLGCRASHSGAAPRALRRLALAATLAVSVAALGATAAGAAGSKYRSVDDALDQGLSAVNGNYPEMAEPALQFVIKNGGEDQALLGRFYLARIYADNNGARTDHKRAFELYQRIADDYADIDPDDDRRSPFVAKSLIALAGYLRRGLPEIGRAPNPHRAAEYLRHAATIFGDEDAQFELAKMQLKGEGIDAEPTLAKHWLATLSQKGHVGAQAFLADLYWRGKDMERDPVRALALITVALQHAPATERVWIADIYQNIFCGTGEGVRKQATGLVADWRDHFSRKPEHGRDSGLGSLGGEAVRTCKDGSPVAAPVVSAQAEPPQPPLATPHAKMAPVAESTVTRPPAFARGSTLGLGLTGGGVGGGTSAATDSLGYGPNDR